MHIPDGGGGRTAAVQTLDLTLGQIRRIGKVDLTRAEDEAEPKFKRFAGQRLPDEAFGGSPKGRELGRRHSQAHAVFTETIDGVLKDLVTFRDRLLSTVNAYEGTDDAVEQTLTTLGKRDPGPSHADRAQQDAVDRHAKDLPVGPAGGTSNGYGQGGGNGYGQGGNPGGGNGYGQGGNPGGGGPTAAPSSGPGPDRLPVLDAPSGVVPLLPNIDR